MFLGYCCWNLSLVWHLLEALTSYMNFESLLLLPETSTGGVNDLYRLNSFVKY